MTKQRKIVLMSVVCLVALFFSALFIVKNNATVDNHETQIELAQEIVSETENVLDLSQIKTESNSKNVQLLASVPEGFYAVEKDDCYWFVNQDTSAIYGSYEKKTIDGGDKFTIDTYDYNDKTYYAIYMNPLNLDKYQNGESDPYYDAELFCFVVPKEKTASVVYYVKNIFIGNASSIESMTSYAKIEYRYEKDGNGVYNYEQPTGIKLTNQNGAEIQSFTAEDIDPKYGKDIYFIATIANSAQKYKLARYYNSSTLDQIDVNADSFTTLSAPTNWADTTNEFDYWELDTNSYSGYSSSDGSIVTLYDTSNSSNPLYYFTYSGTSGTDNNKYKVTGAKVNEDCALSALVGPYAVTKTKEEDDDEEDDDQTSTYSLRIYKEEGGSTSKKIELNNSSDTEFSESLFSRTDYDFDYYLFKHSNLPSGYSSSYSAGTLTITKNGVDFLYFRAGSTLYDGGYKVTKARFATGVSGEDCEADFGASCGPFACWEYNPTSVGYALRVYEKQGSSTYKSMELKREATTHGGVYYPYMAESGDVSFSGAGTHSGFMIDMDYLSNYELNGSTLTIKEGSKIYCVLSVSKYYSNSTRYYKFNSITYYPQDPSYVDATTLDLGCNAGPYGIWTYDSSPILTCKANDNSSKPNEYRTVNTQNIGSGLSSISNGTLNTTRADGSTFRGWAIYEGDYDYFVACEYDGENENEMLVRCYKDDAYVYFVCTDYIGDFRLVKYVMNGEFGGFPCTVYSKWNYSNSAVVNHITLNNGSGTNLSGVGYCSGSGYSSSISIPLSKDSDYALPISFAFKTADEYRANSNNCGYCKSGYYYVVNYGSYITGWTLSITNNWSGRSYTKTLKTSAKLSDIYNSVYGDVWEFSFVLTPTWQTAYINVVTPNNSHTTSYGEYLYGLSSSDFNDVAGKTLIASTTSAGNAIKIQSSFTWNFTNIPYYCYSTEATEYYEKYQLYTINLYGLYATNIYRVQLDDIRSGGTLSGYSLSLSEPTAEMITFASSISDVNSSYTSGDAIKSAYDTWESGITNKTNTWLHKVYNKDGNTYIYLAQSQVVEGDLPVYYDNQGEINFWYNIQDDGSSASKLAYKTDRFDADYDFTTDGSNKYVEVEFNSTTYQIQSTEFKNSVALPNNFPTILYANYHRLKYYLTANITLSGTTNNAGYAKLVITDSKNELPTENYVIYNNLFYNLTELPSNSTSLTGGMDSVLLCSGCSFVVTAYDQYDAYANLGTDIENYLDFIGKKFSSISITDNLTDSNSANNIYSVGYATIANKKYANGQTLDIQIDYDNVLYSLIVKIDDFHAGSLNVYQNGTQKEHSITSMTLTGVKVGDLISCEYIANVGFEYGDNPLVFIDLNNGEHISLATKDDSKDQYYTFELTPAILCDCYYDVANTDYSTEDASVGTLETQTAGYAFTHIYKLYDSTILTNNGILSEEKTATTNLRLTSGNNFSFAVNELCETETYEENKIIKLTDGTKYAILNSRLYFPKNPLTKVENDYKDYPFLLTDTGGTRTLTSSKIQNMVVVNYGVIVPVDDRIIYTLIEVRELVEITLEVNVDSNYTTDFPTPSLTLENGNNNIKMATLGSNNVKILSYIGLSNDVNTAFDEKYYSGVNLTLNGVDFNSTKFSYTNSSNKTPTLTASFTTKPVHATVGYYKRTIDGVESEISSDELSNFVTINSAPNSANDLYIATTVGYDYECVTTDYFMTIYINGVVAQSSSGTYAVKFEDYATSVVTFKVLFVEKSKTSIQVFYLLNNSKKSKATDDYGTFDVIMSGLANPIADDVSNYTGTITESRTLSFDISGLSKGYNYVKVLHDDNEIAVTQNGNILTITNSFKETDAGTYKIVIKKYSFDAVLDLTGSSDENNRANYYTMKIDTRSALTVANSNNSKKILTNLYVGENVIFTATETNRFVLGRFYYIKNEGQQTEEKITIEGTEFTITSAILNELGINEDETIKFGFELKNKYLFTYSITGTEYLEEYEVSKENGSYLVENTEISFNLIEKDAGKNDFVCTKNDVVVNFADINPFEIEEDTNIVIEVRPKTFTATVTNKVYNTLAELNSLTPDNFDGVSNSNATAKFGNAVEMKIQLYSTGIKEELRYVKLSGNDADSYRLMIVGNNITLQIYNASTASYDTITYLNSCPYTFKIESNQLVLNFNIENNIQIETEYISNKVISQLQ